METAFECQSSEPPSAEEINEATQIVSTQLPTTPTVRNDRLSDRFDADFYQKREDILPTGAFKVRGTLPLVSNHDIRSADKTVIAASTGNFGQGVAYAGGIYNIQTIIGVPESTNQAKVNGMERYGADVVRHGRTYDTAKDWVEQQARKHDYRYLHSANETDLLAGFCSAATELRSQLTEIDTILVPIGTGAYAASYALVFAEATGTRVVGVQASNSPAMARAWHSDSDIGNSDANTVADGIAVQSTFEMPKRILQNHLDELVVVSDNSIKKSIRDALVGDRLLMEGASAVTTAAVYDDCIDITSQTVAMPITGRNLKLSVISDFLSE